MSWAGAFAVVSSTLYVLCEALARNPNVRANSVYQAVRNWARMVRGLPPVEDLRKCQDCPLKKEGP